MQDLTGTAELTYRRGRKRLAFRHVVLCLLCCVLGYAISLSQLWVPMDVMLTCSNMLFDISVASQGKTFFKERSVSSDTSFISP